MNRFGFKECVRVALEALGWRTTWAEDRSGGNEAGWRFHYDPAFRESRVLSIDLNQTGTLHVVGDDRGAFVFADRTIRLAAKARGLGGDTGVIALPVKEAGALYVMVLRFEVAQAASGE